MTTQSIKEDMGRYFGISNRTKNHNVSEGHRCWKSDSFCDCHAVMHMAGWDKTDDIYTACYDTLCKMVYDPETNTMWPNDITNNGMPDGEVSEEVGDDTEPEPEGDEKTNVPENYGFSTMGMEKEAENHVPVWIIDESANKVCTLCGYKFDPHLLEKVGKVRFDSTFFMN